MNYKGKTTLSLQLLFRVSCLLIILLIISTLATYQKANADVKLLDKFHVGDNYFSSLDPADPVNYDIYADYPTHFRLSQNINATGLELINSNHFESNSNLRVYINGNQVAVGNDGETSISFDETISAGNHTIYVRGSCYTSSGNEANNCLGNKDEDDFDFDGIVLNSTSTNLYINRIQRIHIGDFDDGDSSCQLTADFCNCYPWCFFINGYGRGNNDKYNPTDSNSPYYPDAPYGTRFSYQFNLTTKTQGLKLDFYRLRDLDDSAEVRIDGATVGYLDPSSSETYNLSEDPYTLTDNATYDAGTHNATIITGDYLWGRDDISWDELLITTYPVIPVLNHFKISHPGTAVTCMAVDVSFTAHDESHDPVNLPAGSTLSLSTNTTKGTWSKIISGNGTLTDSTSGDGKAEYTFPGGESSTTLALDYTELPSGTSSTRVDIHTEYNGISEDSGNATSAEDPSLLVSRSGFVFINQTDGNQILPTQISGKDSNQAPNDKKLALQAVKSSDQDQNVCEPVFSDQSVSVQLAAECRNPDTCSGRNLKLTNNGTTYTIQTNDENNATLTTSYTDADLQFSGNSTAPIIINYPDAGKMQLHARHEILYANGTASGNYMVGSSNQFVVRPFGFEVNVLGPNSTARNASDTKFKKAGSNFTVEVTAKCWDSKDDNSTTDGIPDGHGDQDPTNNANLSDNNATLNFGQESDSESVKLSSYLWKPDNASAADPGLNGVTTNSSFADSSGNFTGVQFREVGIIELNATIRDGDYLGIGSSETSKIVGSSGPVGRFYPDHFDVTNSTVSFCNACFVGAFTYIGQPFYYDNAPSVTLTAQNAQNGTTQNYDEAFWKFGNKIDYLGSRNYTDQANASAFLEWELLDNANATDLTDFDGSWKFSLQGNDCYSNSTDGDKFSYQKNGTEDPFNAAVDLDLDQVDLTDQDGVCYQINGSCSDYTIEGISGTELRYGRVNLSPRILLIIPLTRMIGTELRYGRVNLSPAYGSELLNLDMQFEVQYYNATIGFTLNELDDCTQYSASNMTCQDINLSDDLVCSNVEYHADENFVSSGRGEFSLRQPSTNRTGTINCTLTLDPWLGNDTAPATFGIYK